MAPLFEELANLDRMIHEPARLSILTALSACKSADFLFLQRLTGLTAGNLSSHLNKLQEAGLLQMEKAFVGKRPNTLVQITPQGRQAIDSHWKRLEELRKDVQGWSPGEPPDS
jgi:DNA-binding MarR family transcriptional regulator